MADSHASTLTFMLADLQEQLRQCTDIEERNSLRLAIKHLRTTQELLNPGSNLRRSRRKILKREDGFLAKELNNDVLDCDATLNQPDQIDNFSNESLSTDVTFIPTGDVTSGAAKPIADQPGVKKTEASGFDRSTSRNSEDRLVADFHLQKSPLSEVLHDNEHRVPASEVTAATSRRESRTRSTFPHLLKLRGSKSSKEHEAKSPPPLTSPDDKPSLGKRRFSKRFRKRSSKAFAGEDSGLKSPTAEVESTFENNPDHLPTFPSASKFDAKSDSSPNRDLTSPAFSSATSPEPLNGDLQDSTPLPIHSEPPDPASPKKTKGHEHHAQRRKSASVRVIRRAIDRLFQPKHKYSVTPESSDRKAAHSSNAPVQQKSSTISLPETNAESRSELNSASLHSESSFLDPLIDSTPPSNKFVENDLKMTEVLCPPQDVAHAPNQPVSNAEPCDVIEEKFDDLKQQRPLLLNNQSEKSEQNEVKQEELVEESLGESVCVEEPSCAVKSSVGSPDKSTPSLNTNNSSLNSPSTTTPPWAANQVKKNTFKSIQFVTPTSRPIPKESHSAPPAVTKTFAPKEDSSSVPTPTSNSSVSSESTPNSRFGKREFSASFKTYRPSYKLPDHVKSRAESFRLHRPKDFIKPTSAEEPIRSGNSDRIVLDSVPPVSNRSPAPFSSAPVNKETSSAPQISTSSLQRSESCKENQRNQSQDTPPFIPITRSNKRRSRGILSKILSSKIDSEKAQQAQNQQKLAPPPASNKSFDTSPVTKSLQSVCEEKPASQANVSSDITVEDSAVSKVQQTSSKDTEAPFTKEPVLETPKETKVTGQLPQSSLQNNDFEAKPSDVTSDAPSELSIDVIKFISNLVDQVVSLIKEDNFKVLLASAVKENLSCTLQAESSPSETVAPIKNSPPSTATPVEVVVEESCKPVEVEPIANCPVSLLQDLPETSLEDLDCFPAHSDSSLSIDSSDIEEDFEDGEKMEGKYSLRSRRREGTGSVKARIQDTESRNGVETKSTELKRSRHGMDSRAFRNAEGVKSRMNKFATMVSSSTPNKSPSKKVVSKQPDTNNNINGETPVCKTKLSTNTDHKSKMNSRDSSKHAQQITIANATTVNGHLEDSAKPLANGNVSQKERLPKSPTRKTNANNATENGTSNTKVIPVENRNGKQETINETAPLANGVNRFTSPPEGGKVVKDTAPPKHQPKEDKPTAKKRVPQLSLSKPADDVIVTSPIDGGKSLENNRDSKQTDVAVRNDVTEEKGAPKPARRGRRRSSKNAEKQGSEPTTPTVEIQGGVQTDPDPPAAVEVTSRRRRRVRKSSDVPKTSGSVSPASTPERESQPLVPVKISDVESVPSPTTPVAKSVPSPVSPAPIPEIKTEDAQTTRDAVTSRDVIDEKGAAAEKHIKVKRVHSAPADESEAKITIKANKEQTIPDANNKNTSIEQIKENTATTKLAENTKLNKEKMAPQTPTEVRYTMNNINDCNDEAVLQKMLSEATQYEDRKRIRSALRNIKRKQTDGSESSNPVSPTSLSPTSPTNNARNLFMRTTSQETRSHVESTRVTKDHHEIKTFTDKYSYRSTTLGGDMSSSKKVGSIFDREEEEPRKTTQVDKRRELVRNRSMPASSAKDARKLFVAKLEGGSGGAKTGKKVGRSPTFVVPNANNVKQMLLKWCQSKTRSYENVDINNFSGSWANGMAFCALVHNFFPDAFDFSTLDPKNRAYNFELAFTKAQELANADPLLDVEDMMIMGNRPDSKCVFTYAQSLYNKLRKFEKPLAPLTPTEKKPEVEAS